MQSSKKNQTKKKFNTKISVTLYIKRDSQSYPSSLFDIPHISF